jgi:transcriptional regulator with AAA-type ATPase domain
MIQSSEASVFHEIEENMSTLFLDEMEKLRSSSKQALVSILNSGYSKTGSIPRSVNGKTKHYSTYSPKMFAGINDISDTLTDRSIKIPMLRKREKNR